MRTGKKRFIAIAVMALACVITGCTKQPQTKGTLRRIMTSDTILSGMVASLLPKERYRIEAIIPPGQCPGHYDIKLSDIEKMKNADLTVSYSGIPALGKPAVAGEKQLLIPGGEHNWMVPEVYLQVLGKVAEGLSERFPTEKMEIERRMAQTARTVAAAARALPEKVRRSPIFGKPVIASSMQREMLEWMGLRVVGQYGRQEAISTRQVAGLIQVGRDQHVVLVVDNLQSGPDTGKAIAEALGTPHVVLTNYPSETGYLATLGENVNAVLAASEGGP
jgi:zinc transport system substrate-binding protein